MSDDYYIELARKICAAFISMKLGIGLEYAYKRYTDEKPGKLWIDLAMIAHGECESARAGRKLEDKVM